MPRRGAACHHRPVHFAARGLQWPRHEPLIESTTLSARSDIATDWAISGPGPVDYADALAVMEERVAAIANGSAPELVWLLEHPPLYTAGTSTRWEDLVDPGRFPVYRTGRGGQLTYHGPGQRVVYTMLDVRRRTGDIRAFVRQLESWAIATIGQFGVRGETRAERVGVWVRRPERGEGVEDKIAAIGIRIRRWISFHGLSLNVSPDLGHFTGIVPCGVRQHGVTSLADLGRGVAMSEVDAALAAVFEQRMGAIRRVAAPVANREAALRVATAHALALPEERRSPEPRLRP
ncbi:MAG: lipoyl(octanoyl) transferase LipB [Hyphomicrobiaceae bacterium]|nr:lipoyl(octanoyl) transferase LipB [Hyphomicrobiaceae bacterium]